MSRFSAASIMKSWNDKNAESNDIRHYPWETLQGYNFFMPKIIAREMPDEGDEFNVHMGSSLWTALGTAVSIFFDGARVGLARVVHNYEDDDRYTVETCGGRISNLAKNVVRMKVEHMFNDDDC